MPTYAFKCAVCKYELDLVKKMSEPDPIKCPCCREEELKQVIASSPFHLKGDGWYETDFKDKGKK